MKKKMFALSALPLLGALVLEILPFGAVLYFASYPGDYYKETYSYFSLLPFGYANFFPFITAVLTVILLVLSIIYMATRFKADAIQILIYGLSVIAFVISLLPVVYGIKYISLVGVLISVFLLASIILQKLTTRMNN